MDQVGHIHPELTFEPHEPDALLVLEAPREVEEQLRLMLGSEQQYVGGAQRQGRAQDGTGGGSRPRRRPLRVPHVCVRAGP